MSTNGSWVNGHWSKEGTDEASMKGWVVEQDSIRIDTCVRIIGSGSVIPTDLSLQKLIAEHTYCVKYKLNEVTVL